MESAWAESSSELSLKGCCFCFHWLLPRWYGSAWALGSDIPTYQLEDLGQVNETVVPPFS